MREPTEQDRLLTNDASNRLQLVPELLLMPIPRRKSAVRPFVELPNEAHLDHVIRTYRRDGLRELQDLHPTQTYLDPDSTDWAEQIATADRIASAILDAAQEDRFS